MVKKKEEKLGLCEKAKERRGENGMSIETKQTGKSKMVREERKKKKRGRLMGKRDTM